MEKVSIVIPVYNKIDITLRCIEHIRRMNDTASFELVIADNGSSDATQDTLTKDAGIVYIRNQGNLGIARACNEAAGLAHHGIFCFMHNDVYVWQQDWVSRLAGFIMGTRDAGVVGLYGAKVLRKDGSFRGKTIVHAKKASPVMKRSMEKVAVVDGLLLAMKREAFTKVGGFNEDFAIHYYDKDISMRSLSRGMTNYILNVPFEHAAATTRKGIREDDKVREEARMKFIGIWRDHLPADASIWQEKVSRALSVLGIRKKRVSI